MHHLLQIMKPGTFSREKISTSTFTMEDGQTGHVGYLVKLPEDHTQMHKARMEASFRLLEYHRLIGEGPPEDAGITCTALTGLMETSIQLASKGIAMELCHMPLGKDQVGDRDRHEFDDARFEIRTYAVRPDGSRSLIQGPQDLEGES